MYKTFTTLLVALTLIGGTAATAHAGSRWMAEPTSVSVEAGRKLLAEPTTVVLAGNSWTKSGSAWK